MAQVEALQSAFIALIPTAEPERAEKVLRLANSCSSTLRITDPVLLKEADHRNAQMLLLGLGVRWCFGAMAVSQRPRFF